MTLSKGAQVALLKWVNTFDGLDRRADSLDDLKDGTILAQVLHILNPDFDRSALNPNASSWLDKKRNLEIVYRSLAQFLRQENPYLAPSPNQFRTIVDNPDANGMCEVTIPRNEPGRNGLHTHKFRKWLTEQFLSAFVSAACLGDLAPIHVPAIMTMDRPDQREIMAIIQRKQQQIEEAQSRADMNGDDDDDETPPPELTEDYSLQGPSRDPDLEREAEIASLRKELDMSKKQNADLLTRNEQLQISREDVVQDLQIAQREVDVLRKTNESDASAIIRKLEQEKREEAHLIDTLQAQAEDDRLDKLRLRNEVEHLKSKADRAGELEDRVKELEHEMDSLSSKLKQAEWYKKSAEQAKITDQKNRELESQNHELREQLQELDRVKTENEMLHHTCQQYRKQMGTYESEKFEDQAVKSGLKEENETLKLEKQVLADQLRIGEDQMRDLQERLQINITPQAPPSPGANGISSNLEQELETTNAAASSDPAIRLRLELSRLEAENKFLKGNMGVTAENQRLRAEADFEKQKHKHLEDMYAEANNKHILAQEQIKVLLASMKGDRLVYAMDAILKRGDLVLLTLEFHRDQAFLQKKKQLDETLAEVDRLRARIQKLESESADKDRELLAARADGIFDLALLEGTIITNRLNAVDAVGQQSIDALGVLKSSDELISSSLKLDLEAVREKLKLRDIELDQLRQQLTNALVSKDKLRQQLDDAGIPGISLKTTSPQSPTSAAASEGEGQQQKQAPKKDDTEKNEKLKTALKQKVQVSPYPCPCPTPLPSFSPRLPTNPKSFSPAENFNSIEPLLASPPKAHVHPSREGRAVGTSAVPYCAAPSFSSGQSPPKKKWWQAPWTGKKA